MRGWWRPPLMLAVAYCLLVAFFAGVGGGWPPFVFLAPFVPLAVAVVAFIVPAHFAYRRHLRLFLDGLREGGLESSDVDPEMGTLGLLGARFATPLGPARVRLGRGGLAFWPPGGLDRAPVSVAAWSWKVAAGFKPLWREAGREQSRRLLQGWIPVGPQGPPGGQRFPARPR